MLAEHQEMAEKNAVHAEQQLIEAENNGKREIASLQEELAGTKHRYETEIKRKKTP